MRIPAYLRLSRHGIYYFRIVVPKAQRPRFSGRSEVKVSLHTRDLREAMLRARNLALAAHQRFRYADGMSVQPVDPNDPSTWPKAGDPNLRNFEKVIERPTPGGGMEIIRIKADPNNALDVAIARAEAAKEAIRSRHMANPNSPEAEAFYRSEEQELQELLRRAESLEDVSRAAEADRLRRAGQQPTAAAPSSPIEFTEPIPSPSNGRVLRAHPKLSNSKDYKKYLLSALFPRFLNERKKKIKFDEKSEGAYQKKFDTFIEWFGDTHVEDVTVTDIAEYKEFLLHDKVVEAGKRVGQVGLDIPTVDNYTGVLNGLFKWAQRNGYYPRQMVIPTDAARIMTKSEKKARAQSGHANRAFKASELKTAFKAENYLPEMRLAHHYWPPLIALFTGMRLGEVSQLAWEDIGLEEGLWAISINDDDYKRLKSPAARRVVPMHPELVALGLPEFAKDVASLGLGPQLFPVLVPVPGASIGNAPGKKWDLYLKTIGLTDDALTYHSFRRTANTLLKKAKVPFDVRCQMVGHDLPHTNELYATDYTVSELAQSVMPKFIFPGLDLTPLKYKPAQFNDAIGKAYPIAVEKARRRIEAKAKGIDLQEDEES
jgi:integrase